MRMNKEVLKKVLKACEAAIKKLDKENKTFIDGTGYSDADKKKLLSAVEAMEQAAAPSLEAQYKAMLKKLETLKKHPIKKYAASIAKAENEELTDEEKQKKIEELTETILAFIWVSNQNIGKALSDIAQPLYLAILESAYQEFGGQKKLEAKKKAEEWAKEYREAIAGILNTSTKEMIRDLVYRILRNNLSLEIGKVLDLIKEQITKLIQEVKRRARTIAQTEAIKAANTARYYAAIIAGMTHKTWHTVGDNKVRDWHRAANGQTVPILGSFIVHGESLRYPGDPKGAVGNIIRCRCWIDYTRGKEKG